ncbi:MAG: ParB N-terminal domain-containing protein [Aphanocapsa sp. GSE-SYN-MK-11-07L]|jgi:hypothetical protein|nr:ParB N-terminal domain-containing protein [Aphanocapsa sp. GSE-SYN-MK-11-07L]
MARKLVQGSSNVEEILPVNKIRKDGGTQPRSRLDRATIDRYAEAIRSGYKLSACDVHYNGVFHYLSDGFHRFEAYATCGITDIPVIIHQGSLRDAILFSKGANAEHGLPRSENDKRRAVVSMLADEEWSKWSNREIAKACKVSEYYVRTVKNDLSAIETQISENDCKLTSRNNSSESKIKATAQSTGLTEEMVVAAKTNVDNRQEVSLARRGNTLYAVNTGNIGKNRTGKNIADPVETIESTLSTLHTQFSSTSSEQPKIQDLDIEKIRSPFPAQVSPRQRLKNKIPELPAEVILHPKTEGKTVEIPDFSVEPGSLWKLSEKHLLFCGSISSPVFTKQLPSEIELFLNFYSTLNLPAISARCPLILPLDYSVFGFRILRNFIEEVLLTNTDGGSNVVVADSPDPPLLLLIHLADCIFHCASSSPSKCKDIIWFWRMSGRHAKQIS